MTLRKAIQTRLQARPGGRRPSQSPSWAVTAVVCLVLTAFLAVMQVPHLHTSQSEADHCPLCVVMHSTAPAAPAVAAVVLVPMGAPEPQAEPILAPKKQPTRIFIRPPPSGC
ncbi:MAG TPA: hypothetical protein VMD55_06065 [Terracidiphilus sp.]|nr:hypothetical protein [Terracidiphilus sp.]